MPKPKPKSRFQTALERSLLALDSFVDSAIFSLGQSSLSLLRRLEAAADRLHTSGSRKLVVELLCEAHTVAIAGFLFLMTLAQPAMHLTTDDAWLKRQDLAVTFLDRYGAEVGRRGIKHDDAIAFDELPDHFIKAVLATEDRRFFSHFGIDAIGTLRAVTVNARASGVVQGGSSITQQLAKNVFLTNERSLQRKISEAFLAIWLEHHLTKKQILGLYLDRAYMGGGAYGVQAAAQLYFGKSARDINLSEAAMLAGLFKAPTKYSPNVNLPAARARANDVLSNLVDAGFMTEGQVYAARRNPATPVDLSDRPSPDWYLDFAYTEIKDLADAGKLGDERILIVRTGLDLALQAKAEAVIEEKLRVDGPTYHSHQAAAVVAETDGLVRAMVGGRDYGASQFNRATDALRQPGSSFKPFVYLTALMTGDIHANTIVDASPIAIGDYAPHNFNNARVGRLPLLNALEQSLNTVAIRLSVMIGEHYWPKKQSYHLAKIAALGRSKIVETAKAMGITTPLLDSVSLPLGADGVHMIDMVSAYAAFANGGKSAKAHSAAEVRNSRGELVYSFEANGPPMRQVIAADKIAEINNMLKYVITDGTGRAAIIPGLISAGKTGTTSSYKDAWFDAFTGNLVCSVWFGNDDYQSMENGSVVMTGGTLPAQTWHDIMQFAHQGLDAKPPFGVVAPGGAKPAEVAAVDSKGVSVEAKARAHTLPQKAVQIVGEIGDFAHSAQARRAASERVGAQTADGRGIVIIGGGALQQ